MANDAGSRDTPAGATGGFLSRWSRRKEQVRAGAEVDVAVAVATAPEPVAAEPMAPVVVEAAPADASVAAPPPLTLADVALLTRDSDYARFITPGIDEGVKRAAMKKLFTDPHFNIMDGLDTYIDDYGKPDPIPLAMLRQMNQSKFLRLFDDDEEKDDDGDKEAVPNDAATASTARLTDPTTPPDDDPDLRLQQDDDARRPGPHQGPRA